MKKHLLTGLALLFWSFIGLRAGNNPPASLSGTYLVGNSQPVYKKLTDVAAALNNAGNRVTGNVIFELNSDYTGTTGETFPIVFNQFSSSGGSWTVTIRPKTGVSMRTTAGNPGSGQALIVFDGAHNINLDGRAGGSGSAIGWLIRTTNTNSTIRLVNDAQNNTLTWLQLEGQNSTNATGIVHLSGTTGTEGNDDNTISYCNIRDRSDEAGSPAAGITISGATTNASAFNSGNTITHNNIFNIFRPGTNCSGIYIQQGATATSITYNSFYQTGVIENNLRFGLFNAIWIIDPETSHTTVSHNFIGGTGPQCGGSPFTMICSGEYNGTVGGIFFSKSGSTGAGNTIGDNTIRNFELIINQSTVLGLFKGIQVSGSVVDVTNNTIGDPNGHDDIQITVKNSGTQQFTVYGITFYSEAGGSITGNKIGGFTFAGGLNLAISHSFCAINASLTPDAALSFTISDNTIGSTTINDNINFASAVTAIEFNGIQTLIGAPGSLVCNGNTIAGVALAYSGKTINTYVSPIRLNGTGAAIVDNNLISDISSATLVPGPGSFFNGISAQSSAVRISNNVLRRLRLTGTAPISGSSTSITGISVGNAQTSEVYNNKLYDITSVNSLTGSSSSAVLTGIDIRSSSTIYNNLVSLNNGTGTNNCAIIGIRLSGFSSIIKLYHNTVYVGGSNGVASNNAVSSPVYNTALTSLTLRNNLLVNGRTGGSGGHYIFNNAALNPGDNWAASTSDYNVLVAGSAGAIGRWGTFNLDFTQWKTTGGDAHSSFHTVSQIAPVDLFTNISTGDLSIKQNVRDYAGGKGTAGIGISIDYAALSRSATAPSAGAYEYAFSNIAPVITSHDGVASVSLRVPENTTTATTVTAADANAGTRFAYSLVNDEDSGKFSIDPSTGILVFIAAPDFELPGDSDGDNTYVVTVQVSDGGLSATQRLKIKITDVNDHAPAITSYNGDAAVTLRIPENTIAVATVTATDVDKNTTITYSLVNEEDVAKFSVNSSTGQLSFIAAPDFEHPGDTDGDNVYVVTVKASDGDSVTIQRFKIKITAVNDNAPVITSHNGDAIVHLQIMENTTVLSGVTATDADAGTVITYSIVNGDDGALFSVNSTTGKLDFITAPDFEHPADDNADNVYIVKVQASDGDLTATQWFEIQVNNSNDSPLVITTTMQLPENTLGVTTVGATDDDADITVSILAEGDGALFSFDPATGELSFITAPDFEHPADANGDNVYVVSVKMFDGSVTTILRLNVSISDMNGTAARSPSSSGRVSISASPEEDTITGAEIRIYPNPVTGKKVTLRMDSIPSGRYMLQVYTATGRLVYSQSLNHTGKSVGYPIQLPSDLTRGMYMLKLAGTSTRYAGKMIID